MVVGSLARAQRIITTFAGSAGGVGTGDGGPATEASLGFPDGLAVDAAGNLFIADTFNHRIRRVSPDDIISTVAGNGIRGFSGDGGPATNASLANPDGLAVDAAGNLFIADTFNHRIRRVSPDGIISTVAGSEFGGFFSGDGGPATDASLAFPQGVAVDAAGNLFVADTFNHRIRQVSPDGIISTVAGNGIRGLSGDGGPATNASLANPDGLAVDAAGNLFIADSSNHRIRRVSPDGIISKVAGSEFGGFFSGDGGPATNAAVAFPRGLALDTAGNLFIADTLNFRIRRVSPDGIISTVAGNGTERFSGDGGAATSASLVRPQAVAVDAAGNLFIADTFNHRIRQVSPDGIISTVAGNGRGGFSGDGGPATNASLVFPEGLALDAAGNLFIADAFNDRIRQVSPDGIISTVAGNGIRGFSGDGGPATNASLDPDGLAVDAAGNLFIADFGNGRIRRVSPDGIISTVAGNGIRGFSGDGGPATDASISFPHDLALDAAGNLFIADSSNHRIRRVSPDDIISTVAGDGIHGFSGDGGPATNAALASPGSVAVDAAGNLFIADVRNSRIRVVLAEPPRFSELSVREATLAARSGAMPVEAESVLISASVVNLPSLNPSTLPQASFSTSTDAPWLTVSPPVGMTPRLLRIQADPAELAPGDYQGRVTVTMPDAQPAQQVIFVSFAVGAPLAPKLSVDAEAFSFTYSSNAAARS